MAFPRRNVNGFWRTARLLFVPFARQSTSSRVVLRSPDPDFTSLFECPVCRDYALPPIHQCENGHIVCVSCLRRMTRCAICEKPAGKDIRNLAMERLAMYVSFPCKYELNGCAEKLSVWRKRDHEVVCDYRPCPCILGPGSCTWEGSFDEVLAHVDRRHNFVPKFHGELVIISAGGFNRLEPFGWVALQLCFGRVFVVQMRKYQHIVPPFEYRLFVAVQLVGSRADAQKFACRIELRNQGRRLALDAMLRSVREGIEPLQLSNGIVFKMNTVMMFSDGSNLNIGVKIFRL